jgi:hypothetical protein
MFFEAWETKDQLGLVRTGLLPNWDWSRLVFFRLVFPHSKYGKVWLQSVFFQKRQ